MGAENDSGNEDAISVVLADDHQVVRTGLRGLIEANTTMVVVAEAGDVEAAKRYVLGHKPDVLVLDLNMPGGSSIEAIPEVHKISPKTKIIILTMQDDPAFASQAMSAGASGYVLKEAAEEAVVEAIQIVASGRTYLQPSVGAKLAAGASGGPQDAGLSAREADVLRLIALGHTNAGIADQLYLSVRTIESHRAHIQQKLDANTRAELVRFAIDNGLIDLSPPPSS